jgi:hypothetical protein
MEIKDIPLGFSHGPYVRTSVLRAINFALCQKLYIGLELGTWNRTTSYRRAGALARVSEVVNSILCNKLNTGVVNFLLCKKLNSTNLCSKKAYRLIGASVERELSDEPLHE